MKYLILLIPFFVSALDKQVTVQLSCNDIINYMSSCASNETPVDTVTEAKEHWIKNQIIEWNYQTSATVTEVVIRYKDDEFAEQKAVITGDTFRAKIEVDVPFHIHFMRSDGVSVTHRDAFRLALEKDTLNEIYKMQHPLTKGWRHFDIHDNNISVPMVQSKDMEWL